jgi:hypothetical protein
VRSVLPFLVLLVLVGGCGEIREASGAVVRVQACEDAIATAQETAGVAQSLSGDHTKLREALDGAAEKLDDQASASGDADLNDAISGLADSYRDIEMEGDVLRKVASSTASYLQVITASCAAH